ncbi:MAG: benzoyl-CoA reductase subunit A [Saprospiraceae bacterium]|nr:benzoyl-CoA reductase subunit A [Saprospiraceae bacterium]
MKKYYLGIDLGSTTSKAIIIDDKDQIMGRGITNTRANYKVAADIARQEAIYDARFNLLHAKIQPEIQANPNLVKYLEDIRRVFQYVQFRHRMKRLEELLAETVESFRRPDNDVLEQTLSNILQTIGPRIRDGFLHRNLGGQNQFFRDIVSEQYNLEVSAVPPEFYEPLMLAFDKSITPVENEMFTQSFEELVYEAMRYLNEKYQGLADQPNAGAQDDWYYAELNSSSKSFKSIERTLTQYIDDVVKEEIHIANMVGTGYGRALLPFPEDCIMSEILCHAYGAHAIFPNTRTVLDIGGQDTKAIQVDKHGLVTSFHMNDRCAAGCGRYLGYIADEFGLSLNELGPEALSATRETTICSTCTVFAGAEVKELLHNGEERPNILAGLHKAIVQRAMSLLARSGGVRNEFTFTGGVARNQAVLKYVTEMVRESYGELTMNIHTDSIFMGALGGALFARKGMIQTVPKEVAAKAS